MEPRTHPRIFVQIPSYRDSQCQWTVKDLFEKAKHPERIFVGICWQYDPVEDAHCFEESYPYPEQVRVVSHHYHDAKGANWGRVQASYLWRGEEYVYMCEPHMRHVEDWDEKLIAMLAECPSQKALLSGSPQPTYELPNILGRPWVSSMTPRHFHDNGILLVDVHYVPDHLIPRQPFLSPVLVVSCLFASSELIQQVPQDPHIYFEGDETSYSARAWTQGWDIYNINEPICYHLHDRNTRPLHWDDQPAPYKHLAEISAQRYRHLFNMPQETPSPEALVDIERYGMGGMRSLAAYEAFIGVNFASQHVGPVDRWLIKDDGYQVPQTAPYIVQQWNIQHLTPWLQECISKGVDEGHIVSDMVKRGISHENALQAYHQYKANPVMPATLPEAQPASQDRVVDDELRRWLAGSLIENCPIDQLQAVLMGLGVSAHDAQRELAELSASPFLLEAKELQNTVKKREWLLSMLDEQFRRNGKYSEQIERIRAPRFKTFLKKYYNENVPVVLTHAVGHWPARKWTPQMLKQRAGDAVIQVQFGRESDPNFERNSSALRREMKLADYIDLMLATEKSNDFYMTAGNWPKSKHAFVDLYNDIRNIRDGYLHDASKMDSGFLWIGPAGTLTPLHHDLTNNLFVQVYGRKRFLLIPAMQVKDCYNQDYVYCDVDIFNLDYEKFPNMRNVTIMDVVLNPGEALLIPNCWLHAVEAIDPSISLTFTNFNAPNYIEGYPQKRRY